MPKNNDLISEEEIKALRARAKTITIKDCMAGRMILIEPIGLKCGYCASYSIVESPEGRAPIEVISVGTHGRPDPADSECIAMAVLGEGYTPVESLLPSGDMVHFFKRRK